jgi:hypothetical protein
MARRKQYPTDVTDEELGFAAPYLALIDEKAAQRQHAPGIHMALVIRDPNGSPNTNEVLARVGSSHQDLLVLPDGGLHADWPAPSLGDR